ncbi:IclR family transcriptional regulator [Sediminivirga luteola]|uniref:Glycerol operon regulatory protein n=2 Tax=Sediminivirga luteola TaxID=1774748 RepID=A0A8J2XJS2_9MICO|nr:IclR family transcriptional regulator [Sediminivirga luteola]GGA08127.1 IclR family transcriptional regulator [Sediminivirga luteola]
MDSSAGQKRRGEAGMAERGGVQSVQRVLDVLEALAAHGGAMSLSRLAQETRLPVATLHRLAGTLVERGYLRRLPDRGYALGFRLAPLGATAHSLIGGQAEAILAGLVDALGETANLAVRAGDSVEYVAQAPSPHRMRMFTEVGRRAPLHSTGVGKALLAAQQDAEIRAVLERTGMSADTVHTRTGVREFLADIALVRDRGWALDDQEQEIGVRCVAVAVFSADQVDPGANVALSVSGPVPRMDDALVERAAGELAAAAGRLGAVLMEG